MSTHQKTRPPAETSSTWQPSSLELANPSYSRLSRGSMVGLPLRVDQKRRFPRLRVLGALAAVVLIGSVVLALRDPLGGKSDATFVPAPVALLDLAHGSFTVHSKAGLAETSIQVGREIFAGAQIETGGEHSGRPSRAALRLAGGQSLRLDQNTRIRLMTNAKIVLERGAIYLDSASGAAVEIHTAQGLVRDIGTRFEVRVSENLPLRVRVRDGLISFEPPSGPVVKASAGTELMIDRQGRIEKRAVAIAGPSWDWATATAPLPQIEGMTVRAFLIWMAHENAWTLDLSAPQAAERVDTAVVHGRVEGLAPREALEAVLAGSGLVQRLEGDTLRVFVAGAGRRASGAWVAD